MSNYYPDKYVLVKITGAESEPFYKVFGAWHGGFAYGDSWRMNSGIYKVVQTEDMVNFVGSSGSSYIVHKDAVGTTLYTHGVLSQIIEQAKEQDVTIEVVDLDEVVEALK